MNSLNEHYFTSPAQPFLFHGHIQPLARHAHFRCRKPNTYNRIFYFCYISICVHESTAERKVFVRHIEFFVWIYASAVDIAHLQVYCTCFGRIELVGTTFFYVYIPRIVINAIVSKMKWDHDVFQFGCSENVYCLTLFAFVMCCRQEERRVPTVVY